MHRVAVGHASFEPTTSEKKILKMRRSLYVVSPISKGEEFTELNVRSIRPGLGVKPKFFEQILGRRASRNLQFGEPLQPSMIDGGLEE